MNQIRIGLVGYGGIGKVHAYGYHNLHLHYDLTPPDLVGVVAKTEATRRQALSDFPFHWAEADYKAAVMSDEIDAIDCCTPNNLHYPVAMEAIRCGKAIYCEKPLGLTIREARELADLADGNHVPNQVAFNYRFIPAVLTARDLARSGRLGKILQFRTAFYHSGYWDRNRPLSWRLQKEFSGGGALYDLGSHVIDLIRFVTGHEYQAVNASLHTEITERPLVGGQGTGVVDVDDLAILQVKTAQGALGSIEASRLATGTEDDLTFEIYGEDGAIRFNLMEPHWLDFYDEKQAGVSPVGGKGFNRLATSSRFLGAKFPGGRTTMGWLQTHIASQADFITRCMGRPAVGATFREGLAVQKVLVAAQESDAQGKWITIHN